MSRGGTWLNRLLDGLGDVQAMQPTHAFRPMVVHTRADIAGLLARLRRGLGLTCEGLDWRAGWADRYTAKLEHGDAKSGRQGFHISPMAEVWLEALGAALVVMPVSLVEEIGAVRVPATVG